MDFFLNEKPRWRDTYLACVTELARHTQFCRHFDVTIFEDHHWGVTTKLHGTADHVLRCQLLEMNANWHTTGEAQLASIVDDRRCSETCGGTPKTMLSAPGGRPASVRALPIAMAVAVFPHLA